MNPLCWELYQRALRLLPEPFRERYAEQMLQTANDAVNGSSRRPPIVVAWLATDLAKTWIREEARMLAAIAPRRLLYAQAICLSVLSLVIALAAYAFMQQTVRHDANQPQLQMAAQAVAQFRTARSVNPGCSPSCIELAGSLAPFTILYDESGAPLTWTATLDDRVPVPPRGVLTYARDMGTNELTWQPRHDVRLAIVVKHFKGEHYSGFVLTGRSLAIAERGEALAFQAALGGWLAVVALLLGSAAFFSRVAQSSRPALT